MPIFEAGVFHRLATAGSFKSGPFLLGRCVFYFQWPFNLFQVRISSEFAKLKLLHLHFQIKNTGVFIS